jgi:uncharacterized protein (DUF302 family)
MSYHYSIKTKIPYEEALQKVSDSLKVQGFGIITSIDVKDTLKQKLHVDFRRYKILGACNPEFAYKAISLDSHIGVMLPCNVIVQEHENGEVEISAITPLQTLDLQSFPHLKELASEIGQRLRAAVDDLHTDHFRKDHNEALPC